jgi:hypothetical protein
MTDDRFFAAVVTAMNAGLWVIAGIAADAPPLAIVVFTLFFTACGIALVTWGPLRLSRLQAASPQRPLPRRLLVGMAVGNVLLAISGALLFDRAPGAVAYILLVLVALLFVAAVVLPVVASMRRH